MVGNNINLIETLTADEKAQIKSIMNEITQKRKVK